ncbi:MAG: GerMN domain-containing protein [Oscillospiraceae bacterium]|nr:GerMN domain-containing protein [Oscillospiraceae bacterium]
MKKIALLLAFLTALSVLHGCTPQQTEEPSLQFYYKTAEATIAEDGLIGSEAAGVGESFDEFAAEYFLGPRTETLVSPFPTGTIVSSHSLENGLLSLQLSGSFASLTGVNLSLALSCIGLTFSQLEDVDSVEVSAKNQLLGGKQSILLRKGDILLTDNSLALAETTLNIYYSDADSRYLIPQEVKTKLETTEEQAAYAISLLGQAPESGALRTTLPENTEILDLSIEDGLCIVDFSADFLQNRPETDSEERMTILSIVDTLTEFQEINRVQFYVEGEVLSTYYHMDLSLVYQRDENAIGPVRPGLNEIDATLYVLRQRDRVLTELPMRLKSAANESDADTVLRALLEYGEKNGFSSPVPTGTKVLSVVEEGNTCEVDLSASFADTLQTEETQTLAVQSIVNSLKSLDGIQHISITIEGKASGLDYVDLNQIFS